MLEIKSRADTDNQNFKKNLVENLIRLEKSTQFKQIDVKKDCLEKLIIEINPNEMLPNKDPSYVITPWEAPDFK